MPSSLLYKPVKIRIHRTVILVVVRMGVKSGLSHSERNMDGGVDPGFVGPEAYIILGALFMKGYT